MPDLWPARKFLKVVEDHWAFGLSFAFTFLDLEDLAGGIDGTSF